MALRPAALSLLGIESAGQRPRPDRTEDNRTAAEVNNDTRDVRPVRTSRRPTSYFPQFQTHCSAAEDDTPPTYAYAARFPPRQPRPLDGGREILPSYSCIVNAEAKVLLNLESINPLHGVCASEWREVYMVLRGTMINFHRAKDSGPGKLLRSYTLQHAEVGLAPDTQHGVLVPQTRLAHLVPSAARARAWRKDPDLFQYVRQNSLRLRLEADQLTIAHASEECIHAMIHTISAGIDIAHAIDERTIPRQCTVPRRRRRPRHNQITDLSDPSFLAEQERILRAMYPGFAEQNEVPMPVLERINTAATAASETVQHENAQAPVRDEDEVDLTTMRDDFANPSAPPPTQDGDSTNRPLMFRQTTDSSVNSATSTDLIYATSPTNFDPVTGKWLPTTRRSSHQVQRYIRRCLPILLADSARASDILIHNGKRVKVNWRMEVLEDWELSPPSYRSHHFTINTLERTTSVSQRSVTLSANQDNAQTSASMLGVEHENEITRAENALTNLDLSKITSIAADKISPRETTMPKTSEAPRRNTDIHGVVFCF